MGLMASFERGMERFLVPVAIKLNSQKTCCSGERWIRFYVSNYHGKFINYIN
ncbi:PTS system transporter subunit IIC [Escherichia coli]|nr:PTS system transporter subunit IIC [Escherichia coli]